MTPEDRLIWPAPRTFFGAPAVSDLDALDAQVAFLGVPYDAGTMQPGIRTGQATGPTAAREASCHQFGYRWPPSSEGEGGAVGWYDIEPIATTSQGSRWPTSATWRSRAPTSSATTSASPRSRCGSRSAAR